jgi:hypothetical protein
MCQHKKTAIITLTLIFSTLFIGQTFAGSLADVRAEYENITARYMFAFNSLNADDLVATFTEDGIIDLGGIIKRGRQEIREWVEKKREEVKEVKRLRYFITNMVVDVKGDKVTAKAFWVKLAMGNDGSGRVVRYGQYEDSLVYVNGEWLFSKRIVSD